MSVSVFGFKVKVTEDVTGAFRVRATVSVCVVPPPVTAVVVVLVPRVAVNERLAGDTGKAAAAVMVSVTGRDTAEAPVALNITVLL
jgi:hypothetical protein